MYLYVNKCKSRLFDKEHDDRLITELLWGDRVEIIKEDGEDVQCTARGKPGWVKRADLGETGLLEIYIIDVMQGDSVLIRTPDDKWHMIDGGIENSAQQYPQKGASNFLRWKFRDDLGRETVSLENVILTHPDYDHFGGIINVFTGDPGDGRPFPVTVNNFYHSGVGKFKESPKTGKTVKGKCAQFPWGNHGISQKGTFIVELLDGRDSFGNPKRQFEDNFGRFANLVSSVPKNVRSLSHKDLFLPGYGLGENDCAIRVLGPVMETTDDGDAGLRDYGDDSPTVNGNSVVLRLDYGNARILLTGDLNAKSEKLLLSYVDNTEFAADVMKASHHGSDDVDNDFLMAVKARAAVISSGDNEPYAHPRPLVMGAIGRFGRTSLNLKGETYSPLIYSTEVARSVKQEPASGVKVKEPGEPDEKFRNIRLADSSVTAKSWDEKYHLLSKVNIATGLVYGLVNIRTDGRFILCATMRETGKSFDYYTFQAGVDA
ncbi:MAG TPA: MBL fold metallo-hydrolase [Methanoregula sp.]|nr:MBL fold metallo-hydrolase [Methanoregula sp.]